MTTIQAIKRFGMAVLLGGSLVLPAVAAKRALLICVGQYADARHHEALPGIDWDLKRMEAIAKALGYQAEDIHVLRNEQATFAAVRRQFQTWLSEAAADEPVLIYFSGHGSRVRDLSGDEADGLDEVLILYDSQTEVREHEVIHRKALVDDDFNRWLDALPSKRVLVVLDACHTGTATRTLESEAPFPWWPARKGEARAYKTIDGYLTASRGDLFLERPAPSTPEEGTAGIGHVAFTAAQDAEKSVATERGSVFTAGLYGALFAAESAPLTLENWQRAVVRYVGQCTGMVDRFYPQLYGAAEALKRPLTLASLPDPALLAPHCPASAAAKAPAKLRLQADKQDYVYGDVPKLQVTALASGYLYVIATGQDGKVQVLYPWPGTQVEDNYIRAGETRIITEGSGYQITMSSPRGRSVGEFKLQAILLPKPMAPGEDLGNMLSIALARIQKTVQHLPLPSTAALTVRVCRDFRSYVNAGYRCP